MKPRFIVLFVVSLVAIAVSAGSCGLTRRNFRVEGSAMDPTLCSGDYLRLRDFGGTAQRGQILVFRFPLDPSRDFIKRAIGLPGETVQVKDGSVIIDGTRLDEPYILDTPNYDYGPKVVPQDSYFVLGDNRRNSYDSHAWGAGCSVQQACDFVPKELVLGWLPPNAKGCKDRTS